MKRIASIWLPSIAIERWTKTNDCAPDAAIVLTVEGPHGPIIHAVTPAAAARGARPGARLVDARALDPALAAMPADPEGDRSLLQELAKWAGRWSPLIEVDEADALRLDVTGVAHLFGGERGMLRDIQRRFARIGLTVRAAIAPTASAAWALAHHSPGICGEDVESRIAPLHVSALRLDPDAVRTLERLGLKTIGGLAEMPRLALARRFRNDKLVDALDRILGRKPEPLTAAPANTPPRASLRLEEPATHPEAASQALERLVPELVRQLEQRRLGARRLTLCGYRVDGSTAAATVATAIASREPKHLQRLLAGVMESGAALNPEFGFDAFALTADWMEELGAAQDSLVEEPSIARELARLIDRLTVKLGPQAVRRPRPVASHLPERASGWAAMIHPSPEGEGWLAAGKRSGAVKPLTSTPSPSPEGEGKRPQRLLDRPEAIDVIYATPEGLPRRFRWRRAVHDIARAEGPERIAPEWWRSPSSTRLRDYYRVEDVQGRRYWIYREGLIGDGRGGPPNWYIHGLFG